MSLDRKESKVRLHPSSALCLENKKTPGMTAKAIKEIPTNWFIFDEMTRVGHLAMIRGVTAVSPTTVFLFAGPNKLPAQAVSEADAGVQGEDCRLFNVNSCYLFVDNFSLNLCRKPLFRGRK